MIILNQLKQYSLLTVILLAGCSDPLKGRIDINSITEYDEIPPEITFVTTPGTMNGNNNFTLNYTITDDNSGVANAKILYTPDFNNTDYVELTTVAGSSEEINFCVPNKNHPAPAFKIIARDEAGNTFEKELGVDGSNFSINLDTDPSIPTITSSLGVLTKDQPTTLNLNSCSINLCTGDAVYFESPTQTKYVLANTTGTQPAPGDAGWIDCETALASGYLQNNFPSEGTHTYHLWTKTEDIDADSVTPLSHVSSASSTIAITYDNTAPQDNTGTGFLFDNDVEIVGDNLPVQWSLFTDQQVVSHRIELYTDSICDPTNLYNSYTTSSAAITDNTNIDGVVDGQYWAKVIAIDHVGLEGSSACSLDSVFVDATPPVDNGADLQFNDALDADGDDISISWVAFNDLTLTNHRIEIFSDSTCSTSVGTFLTNSTTNTDSGVVDGLNTGNYWATVTAIDGIGSETTSACSTDTIRVDKDSPIDNGANLQFADLYEADGNNVSVTWTAFSDPDGVVNHKLYTYTDSSCTNGETDHGFTTNGTNANSTIITSVPDGQYWAIVEAFDPGANSTKSACSTSFTYVDTTAPTEGTTDLQFTLAYENTGNNIAVTWGDFSDLTLKEYQLYTYTDSSCSTGVIDHGLTGSTTAASSIISGLTDGTYYGQVRAHDQMGLSTLSACSSDAIVIDLTAPTDNTADIQFTNAYNNSGDNVNVSWTAFDDTNLSDHRIYTYTDGACSLNQDDHGLTGSATNSDGAIIDGLADGVYYIKVTAIDLAGNETTSACSTDTITIDTTAPDTSLANFQFTDDRDIDGNDIAATWTAATDLNGIVDYQILTYTNSTCSTGETSHPYIGSNTTSDAVTIDGLADGTYYAKVRAQDSAGNTSESPCSTDSIIIDSTAPIVGPADIQFALSHENTGNNIAISWTAFDDLTLSDHEIYTYTDSACSLGQVNHGLTDSTTNSSTLITGLGEGTYYAKVKAHDLMGFSTESACSTDSIIIDLTAPTDNTAAIQFTNDYNNTGNNLDISWTGFTDTYLSDYRILTYTDSACSVAEADHGLTGDTTVANNTIVDGLTDGVYYAKVIAYDLAGNSTESACSTDTITIDLTPPTDATADLQFTDIYDNDGNDIAVTWTAFTDLNSVIDHQIYTYTDSACTLNEIIHTPTASGINSDATTIDGLTDNIYYAKVLAYDSAGNTTLSACSTDSIEVDTTPPTIGTRQVVGTVVTGQPLGLFNLTDCNDVTEVKITKGAGSPPLATDSGWQTCDTVNYSMTYNDFEVGANNLQFWIKDVAENVQPSFIAHQVFFNPPQLTVENGPTINTNIADVSIDYCAEAGITRVIFKDVDGQPLSSDTDWQPCSTVTGALKSYILTPGDHTLKVYLDYDGDISLNAIDLPVRYEPTINWEESPVINRPQLSFTLENCTGTDEVLINQGTQPLATDGTWQACSTATGAISHTLTSEGEQSLNFWFKDGTGAGGTVLDDYIQITVNFVPPSAYIAAGNDLDTPDPAITIDSCDGVTKVITNIHSLFESAPLNTDFTGSGQDCTTAMNANTSPTLPSEGVHQIDVWFYFGSDGYVLDPWHETITVRYTANDTTPPPVLIGDGAAVPLAMSLENGDASSPPILLDSASRALFTLNTCQPNPPIAMTGTATISADSIEVVGSGTLFTTEISVGDYINIGGEIIKVAAITTDTALELVFPHEVGATNAALTKESPNDNISEMIITTSATAPAADSTDWLACSTDTEALKSKSLVPDGVYDLYAWFKDESGNVSTNSLTQQIEVQANGDTTPPPRPEIIVEGAPEVATAPVNMTVVDCTDVDQIYLKPSEYPSAYVAPDADQSGWQDCSEVTGALEYSVDKIGSYTISAWFKDAAGNINDTPRDVSFIFNPSQGNYPAPVAYWTMDDIHNKEKRYIDSFGDSHLTYWSSSNVSTATGQINQAVQLSGTNSYLVTPNTLTLRPATAVSMSLWVYLTNSEAATKVIAGNIEDGVGGYGFKLDSGNLEFYASGQTASVATTSYTTGWHHISGTSDGRYINIFVDGQLQNTTDLGSPANLVYGCPTLFAIGSNVDCSDSPVAANGFDEKIDEVAIWNKYLSEQDILNIYIDTFNKYKISQNTTTPADIASATFYGETLQNTKLTIDSCGDNKFIYIDETTHPPTVDTPRWQLCRDVIGNAINTNLIQGPHELKIWGKDQFDNITDSYFIVDTTVTSVNYHKPSILHYTMDNDHISGSQAFEMRSGYHAINNGATPSVAGIQNESYRFVKASNTFLETKHAAISQVEDEVSISIWADLTANDNRKQVIAGNRMSGHGYSVEIDDSTNELKFIVEAGGSSREVSIATNSYINGFHNIIGTYDGQNSILYLDGQEVASVDHGTVEAITYSCLGSFTIGAGATCNNGAVTGTHFDNEIDEVLVWDSALSSTVVYELFTGQDTIPPLAVPVTPRDNLFTIDIPVARLNVSDCSDIANVYVALDNTKPTKGIANWQTCSTSGNLVKSSLLEIGANDLKVWFMDAAGNISETSTDLTITYNYNTDAGIPDSYYSLDAVNKDGTTIYDVVSSFHGENYGSIESSGIADEAITFNGVADYIEVPYDASFAPSTEVSLSAWFNVDSFPLTRKVIAGNYNNGGYEIALDNGVVEFKVQALGSSQVVTYPTSSLTAGQWTHVVGIWNNGAIRLFINGIEEANIVVAGSGSIDYAQNNSFLIGAAPTADTGASGNYFDGSIDEVSFYRVALSDTVVNTLFERQSKGDKAYYDITPPEIPVNLNIIYYNSLVSRANLTVTDCTGLDYIIITKNEFPPDKNDEDWQLCNTLTGGTLSKELDPTDAYAKFWTKDLFGNISQTFEYVPIVTNTDKPISRPVVHWTFDDAHYDSTNNEALDRISRLKLKNEGYKIVLSDPGNDSCTGTLQHDNTIHPTTASTNGVLNKSMLFGNERIMRVKSPENSKMKPTKEVSVAAWVYLTGSSTNDNNHIVSTDYNGKGWSLRLEGETVDDKGLRFTVHTAAGTLEPYLETKNYETGWHLVVGTYDGQKASLYFDGIFVKSFSNASPSPIIYEAGLSAFVGSQASLGDEPTRGKSYYQDYSFGCNIEPIENSYFEGEIDEVIIWDTAISGLEASSLYHNGADILYESDTTEPSVPTLTLENTRPELYAGKAYFTVSDCNDISGVLVNEGTRPDKQDDRWQVCRERRGSFGLEDLSDGGHTITTWFKDLAGNVTSTSADIVVNQTTTATIPYANAYWPLDETSSIDRRSVDVVEFGVHDLIEVNVDTDSNPTATHTTGTVNDAINLQGSQSYLTTKSTILLTPVNFLSVGGWFYLTNSDTSTKMYIDRHVYSSTTSRGGYALYQSGGQLRFKLELDIEGTINLATPMSGISTGWNYIVGTFTDQEVILYVNGVQKATSGEFEEQDYVRYDINTDFRVGAESNQLRPTTNFLNERADEIQIWGYDLTSSEVATSYTKGLSGNPHIDTLATPKDVDNAYIYFHSLYGPYAKMTLLNCDKTPWVYITYQGAPTPSAASKDWHRCSTSPGALLSEKLPTGTTYVDVYAKNAYGVISSLPGTKEIDPIPAIADYELVKPVYHASFNDGTISGTTLIHPPSQIGATVSGSPTLNSTNEGGAYDFDGANDFITVNDSFDFEARYNFTIATWAYINNAETATRYIFTKRNSKDDIALFIANGNLNFRVNVVSPTTYSRSTDDIVLSYPLDLIKSGNNHIAVQYDGQKLYLYLNSNLVATEDPGIRNWSTTAKRKVDFDYITGFYIGDNTTNDNHVGFIDDFMVFNQNLTSEQLYYHYKRYIDEVYPSDTTPPATIPNISVLGSTFGTNWPSKTPNPLYSIDDCTDITGVYVTIDGAAAPTNTDTGWQSCNTAEGTISSPTLTPGVHSVYFWYRDARGNIAPAQSIIVEYTDPVLPQPIAYWTFDKNTRISNNYYDSSNQINMSSFGANINTSAKMAEGITTDGSRKYLKTNYDARLKVTDEFTIGFWLDHDLNGWNYGSDDTDRVLSMRGSLPGGFELYVSCDSTSCLEDDDYFNFRVNIDNADYVFDIPRDQFPSTWAYIIYSFDGRFLRFYSNGVLLREKDLGEKFQVTYEPTEEVPLVIGAKPNEHEQISDYGELSMDDLAIWDKALNNDQITELYTSFVNANTRHFDPGLTVITPPDTRATIYNPGFKSFGSRVRLTMSDCTNTNMILVSDSTVQPADDDENWQPCNTISGGILSAPLPSGTITPRVWAKSFTGEVSAASGTANSQSLTMQTYASDIPRPQVHWSLDSTTSGAYAHPYIYDNIAQAHGELDATSPPESTETSGADSVIEKGFDFNGIDEFIKVKPDGNTNPMYTMSISAWAELEKGEGSYRYIAGNIQNVESSSGKGVGLRVINGKLQFYISTETQNYSSSGSNLFVELDTNIYDTGLHHIVGTFNGKKMELFLDGVKVAEKYAQLFDGGTLEIYHDDYSYWNIGADTGSHQTAQSNSFFRGVIDDIMIWSSVLTEQEVYYLYEYGSDLLPTTLADGIPPTDPGIEIHENLTTTSSPWAFFTMPGCTGDNGILINAVYINSAVDPAPNKDDLGWQLCTEDEGYLISQLLTRGDNSVTVYFRDEEGDISSSTTFNITYNPPELIQPIAYYNFNPEAQPSDYRFEDIVGKLVVDTTSGMGTASSPIEGNALSDGGTWHDWISRSYSFEYDFVRDFTISFWHIPIEPGLSDDDDQEGLLLKTGQLEIKRTVSNNIQVSIPFTTITTPQSLIPEQWSHIVVKRENRTLNIYVNGKLLSSARTTPFNLSSKAEQMTFGGPMGSYDELVFYDAPLSDDQIGYLYFKGNNNEQVDLMPLNYVEAPIPDHYWNFNNAQYSGSNLAGVTSNVNLEAINGVTTGSLDSIEGEAFTFTRYEDILAGDGGKNTVGPRQFLRSDTVSPINLNSEFTMSMWLKMPNISDSTWHEDDDKMVVIDQWSPELAEQVFLLRFTYSSGTSGTYNLTMKNSNTILPNHTISTSSIDVSAWHHLVIKREGRKVAIFINGREYGSKMISEGATIQNNALSNPLRIGETGLSGLREIVGTVDIAAGTTAITGTGTNFEDSFYNYIQGQVSVTAGEVNVVGTNTRFVADLSVGDNIIIAGEAHSIASITDNTNLTLNANHTLGATNEYVRRVLTGTVSITAGDTILTGTGTDFTTAGFNGASYITFGNEIAKIQSVDSETQITLAEPALITQTNVPIESTSYIKLIKLGAEVFTHYAINSATSITLQEPHVAGATASRMWVTKYQHNDEHGFDGSIDEFAVWSKALNFTQIYKLYEKGLANQPITTVPIVTFNGVGSTTNDSTIELTLSDCGEFTDVWIGSSLDSTPTDATPGWVACSDIPGALSSGGLTADSLNTIKVWFKTGTTVSSYTSTYDITHETGDLTPPTIPGITLETTSPTNSPFARFSLDSCNDIDGVLINLTGTTPNKINPDWKNCTTIESAMRSPVLTEGANTISVFFKDEAGNVTASSDFALSFEPNAIAKPELYLNFNTENISENILIDEVNDGLFSSSTAPALVSSTVESEAADLTGVDYFEDISQLVTITSDLTISSWINIAQPATYSIIADQWNTTLAEKKFRVSIDNTGRICFRFQTINSIGEWGTSTYKDICSSGKIEFGQWGHIAVSRSGSNVTFYFNSKVVGSFTIDSGDLMASPLPLRIGANERGYASQGLIGSIDETAIWTTALSSLDIEYLYAKGLERKPIINKLQVQAPPIEDYFWGFESTNYLAPVLTAEIGGVNLTNVASTTPTSATYNPSAQIGEAFDYANENLFESNSNSIDLGTDFTISTWFNLTDDTDDEGTILNKWNAADVDEQEFRLYTNNQYVNFAYHATSTAADTYPMTGFDTMTSLNQIPASTWVNVIVTRRNNIIRMYINGELETYKEIGTEAMKNITTVPLRFGGVETGGTNFFTGTIDNTSIWKMPISKSQAKYIYQQGIANLVNPTNPVVSVGNISNTVANKNTYLSLSDCNGNTKFIVQDSALAAPAAATLSDDCSEDVRGIFTNALPATSDTLHIYLGDGASTVEGPYPVNIIYAP
ncbi:LamG-like jellyroll fold domain-containing protein [Halobacteriovorax sp. GFR7]|uniref:LamG-like jellyroll fold domain-containing protein n=1 Tax=unclassified Halobacteriovorax TaxID=2639665 RepID=UPI003D99F330